MFHDGRFHVVPSVREMKYLEIALNQDEEWVLLSAIHIGNLKMVCDRCHAAGKKVIVNHEIVGGLGADRMAFEMLRKLFGVDAVMGSSETKLNLVRREGLRTIRRIALIDSLAVDQVMKSLKGAKYDAIELRPALYAVEYLDKVRELCPGSYMAAGFINTEELLDFVCQKGFDGAMTSCMDLWGYHPKC